MNPWKQRYRGAIAAAAVVFAVGCGSDGAIGADGSNGDDGATGNSALVKATAIAKGDVNCPTGGLLVTTGLDNGDGGGTAGDGVLQTGEIDSSERFCNSANVHKVGDFNPPTGAAGAFFINASGGTATDVTGTGGGGGSVYFEHSYGTNGGHIKLFKTGQVDASFTVPTAPATTNFGATSLVVDPATTVHVKRVAAVTDATTVDAVALVAGDIVETSTCSNANRIYKWNSIASNEVITGVFIKPTGTLQFDHATAVVCAQRHWARFDNAIRNEGTITAGRDATGNSDLVRLFPSAFLGVQGSSINVTGANGGGAAGGNGGEFYVATTLPAGQAGGIWNFGTVTTSGGSGTSGGNGGTIDWRADQTFINTGAVTSKGGDATSAAGTAGSGGTIRLYSGYGLFANSATVDSSGGGGGTTAGSAGYIYLENNEYGDLRNTGAIKAIGGTPTAGCAAVCVGGYGGGIYLFAYGDLFNSGNITSTAGSGLTGTGRDGGYIHFYTEYDTSHVTGYNNGRGTIWVSGNLDSRGGDGAMAAGTGGEVYAYTDLEYSPFQQEIVFFGYGGGITANGGAGPAQGGSANYVGLYNDENGYTDYGDYTAAGAIINYLDISAKGGLGTTGPGGGGGYVEMFTSYQKLADGDFERLVNYGNIDTSGANGGSGGGAADYVYMTGLDGLENHGTITARSGTASAAAGTGGSCDTYNYASEGSHGITMVSDRGLVANTGNLDNRAGDVSGTTATGGASGGILLSGYDTTNSGSLNADGGDAPVADGFGGAGGAITIRSYSGAPTNTGSTTAAGGTGKTGSVGLNGVISINGQAL